MLPLGRPNLCSVAGICDRRKILGASNFFDYLLTCRSYLPANPSNPNFSEFCDPAIDAQIKRALSLDTSDPGGANLLWERIDRATVDKAPWVALSTPQWAYVVSKRRQLPGSERLGGADSAS